jgi:hypothetical protein
MAGDRDASSAKERWQFREGTIDELTFFRWLVIRTNGSENAQLPGSAKYLGGDIRAPRGIAHILRQLFFPAVRTGKASLNCYSRHRYNNCSVPRQKGAIHLRPAGAPKPAIKHDL